MEDVRKLNGKDTSPYDPSLPNEATGVEQSREITDMSRKAPLDSLTTGEFNAAMLKLAVQGREDTDRLVAAIQATNGKKHGWLSPQGVGVMITIVLLFIGGIVGYIHLTDRVSNIESQTSIVNDMQRTLTRMEEREKTQDMPKQLSGLEEYIRDIREDLAAHGLLNKVGTHANTRK